MATPVGTQKRKRQIKKKKKGIEEEGGKNSCFIFSLFRFVNSSENNSFYSFKHVNKCLYIEVVQIVFIKSQYLLGHRMGVATPKTLAPIRP